MSKLTNEQRDECESDIGDIVDLLEEFEVNLNQQNIPTDDLLNLIDPIQEKINSLRTKLETING